MTMILLDPPLLGEDVDSGLPVLMLGVDLAGSSCVFLVCDMEGIMAVRDVSKTKSDFRYNMKKELWYDASQGLGDD